VLRPLLERKGEGHREAVACARVGCGGVVAERPEEETKGWGPCVSEGEGWAGPSWPGGQGPRAVGGAGRPKAKAQAAGPKT
jgi:hypothetical protein